MSLTTPVQGSGFESGYHVFPVRRQHQLGGGALSSEQVDLLLGGAPEATSAGRGRSVQAGEIPRRRGFQGDLPTKRCCSFFPALSCPKQHSYNFFFHLWLAPEWGPLFRTLPIHSWKWKKGPSYQPEGLLFYVRAANWAKACSRTVLEFGILSSKCFKLWKSFSPLACSSSR